MLFKFSNLIFAVIFFSLAVVGVNAQSDAPSAGSRSGAASDKEDYPKGIKESLAKSRIEREKKDYAELLQNGEEAVKLSESLEKTFADSKTLSSEDQKKLDRLEKLAKKIRSELGAENGEDAVGDEKTNEKAPLTMLSAFQNLKSSTVKLVGELKKTTRHSVSVVAIQSSNAFLRIVRFIRFRKN